MVDEKRVHELLALADELLDMAKEFKRLADIVRENEVVDPYFAIIESAGKHATAAMHPVSEMIDMISRLSRKDRESERPALIGSPRDGMFWKQYIADRY